MEYMMSSHGIDNFLISSALFLRGKRLGFLELGTRFDIFQNIHILFLEYGVLSISGYAYELIIPLWVTLVSAQGRIALVSSLMDTAGEGCLIRKNVGACAVEGQ
ncbi:hypothetical protein Tco_0942224 [Tanacetum coccineum]